MNLIRKSQSAFADDGEIDAYLMDSHEKNPTITEYDAIGRVKKITLPHAEGEPGETSITNSYNDPWGVTETHSIGRLVESSEPDLGYSRRWRNANHGECIEYNKRRHRDDE